MSSSESTPEGMAPLPDGDLGALREASISIPPERLEALRQRAFIREYEFRSTVPIVGRLIAAFRRRWNQVSTQWYVRAAIQQQTEFNAETAAMLDHLARQVQAIELLRVRTLDLIEGLSHQKEAMREQSGLNQHVSTAIQQLGDQDRAVWEQFNRQFEFNEGVANSVDQWARRVSQLEFDRQRLAEVFAAYMSESGRELGELAWELQRLRASLDGVPNGDEQ